MKDSTSPSPIVIGGVDTYKDLHVAAVVNAIDTVIGTATSSTTAPATGRCCAGCAHTETSPGGRGRVHRLLGAGLMRHLDAAGIDVLEVTAGDKTDRRKRGKDDTIDAEQAAHATFARILRVTPRAHDGRVESLRALKLAPKAAISVLPEEADCGAAPQSIAKGASETNRSGLSPAVIRSWMADS